MLSHLFKLIWNKKKQNFLLMLEMLVSFMVIFAVFTLLVYYYDNYRKPAGFDYENVWSVNYGIPEGLSDQDSIEMALDAFKKSVLSMPKVLDLTFASNNIPFSASTMTENISYGNHSTESEFYVTESSYKNVLNLKMVEGSWFTRNNGNHRPGVINETLKEKIFGSDNAVGKTISVGDKKIRIVGVVADFKGKGDYQEAGNGAFFAMDSTDYRHGNTMLIKVAENADAAFEARLYKTIAGFSKGTSVEVEHLTKKRVAKNKVTLVPMIILVVVAGFLIFNVALGLFGVLWYNINKRKGEIGLRRAVGASGNSISVQMVVETLVLSTISLTIGSLFAVQFPLLNVFDLPSGVYFTAIALAVAFIFILVTICALYPGRQAAAIYPAVALHEE